MEWSNLKSTDLVTHDTFHPLYRSGLHCAFTINPDSLQISRRAPLPTGYGLTAVKPYLWPRIRACRMVSSHRNVDLAARFQALRRGRTTICRNQTGIGHRQCDVGTRFRDSMIMYRRGLISGSLVAQGLRLFPRFTRAPRSDLTSTVR